VWPTPTRSTSSESWKNATPRAHRRSHPYKRSIPSRNFQRDDAEGDFALGGTLLVHYLSSLRPQPDFPQARTSNGD